MRRWRKRHEWASAWRCMRRGSRVCCQSSYQISPGQRAGFCSGPAAARASVQALEEIVEPGLGAGEWFRSRMRERGLSPDDIRSIDDIGKLPFTVKTDLRDTYPFGLFASPMEDVVRLHASSGTTGKPIVVAYTQQDLEVWTSVMVRSFACCGLHHGDMVQNAYGYGLFTGGLGAHYGAEELGATVIPISGGNTDRQIMVMKDFGVTAICCTPSYFLHMIERAGQLGVDMRELAAARRRFRRRAVDAVDAQAYRGAERHPGIRYLRALRDHRAGRGHRMPLPRRSAHLRRPFLPGDRRSRRRGAAAARGRGRRTGADHAQQAGHADDSLPHARHHRAHARPVRLRTHVAAHTAHLAAAATTC